MRSRSTPAADTRAANRHFTAAACICLALMAVATPSAAQTTAQLALADDDGDFYGAQPASCSGAIELGASNGASAPQGFTIRALSRNFAVAVSDVSGESSLVSVQDIGSFSFGDPYPRPIGFSMIDGLAEPPSSIVAAAWDEIAGRTTIISIDQTTGVGAEIGETSMGTRVVGLSWTGWESGLFGVSRPGGAETVSKLYEIDVATGQESYLLDLPIACEALGLWDGKNYALAAGAEACLIDLWTLDVCVVDWTSALPSPIIAAGEHFFHTPTENQSWGRIKARY